MKAIILAGGIGKRMTPITKDKALLKFLGKELIMHLIEKLERSGVKEFIIICNPANLEQVRGLVGKKAEYVVQEEAKGMADALLHIKNPPKEALIVSAHDIVDQEAYKLVLEKKGDAVIPGYKVSKYFPGGYLIVDGDKIRGIIEKPGEGKEPSNLMNIVIHLHRKLPELFDHMRAVKTDKDDQYEVAMDRMMKDGFDFRVAEYSEKWTALKYPHHILNVMDHFLAGAKRSIYKSAKISDKAVIEGDVVIEDGVRVFEGAVIRGPCYIGKNCVIGNNALIWGGVNLGDNVVVGFSTEIKHSFVGDNTWFHQNYIGDSVISDGCSFGAKTTTANYRFDEKEVTIDVGGTRISTGSAKFGCIVGEGCKTGILSMIMPGVKVGSGSIIGPGVAATKDVEPGKMIMLKQDVTIVSASNIKTGADKKHLMDKLRGAAWR